MGIQGKVQPRHNALQKGTQVGMCGCKGGKVCGGEMQHDAQQDVVGEVKEAGTGRDGG